MKRYLRYLKRKLVKKTTEDKDIQYQIEKYTLLLPSSHKLPEYQSLFKNYDKKLKFIIQIIENQNEKDVIIDIGANVGDTAATIRSFSNSEIYCVEGDKFYLEYLKKNIQVIPNVKIVDSYIVGRKQFENYQIIRSNGTAKLQCLNEEKNSDVIKLVTIQDMIHNYGINPKLIELIKIDTDGFDFDILLANKEYIAAFKPSIYFEYDISFNKSDELDSIDTIMFLESFGYSFIVYDNFGNLLTVVFENANDIFTRLNHYLYSCKKYGGGINYLDIFASVNKDKIKTIIEKDNLV